VAGNAWLPGDLVVAQLDAAYFATAICLESMRGLHALDAEQTAVS
jgi:hypothetical protein